MRAEVCLPAQSFLVPFQVPVFECHLRVLLCFGTLGQCPVMGLNICAVLQAWALLVEDKARLCSVPETQPQATTTSKCPYLGSSPVPFWNIPVTPAAQKDLLQAGGLVLCVVTVPSMQDILPHCHPLLALLQTPRKAQGIHGSREKMWHGTDLCELS